MLTVEQMRLLRNSRCLSAGSDSLYCRSNRQFELKVTHENTPNASPRFKNVIFRHHYVMQKNSHYIETEQMSKVISAEFFTSTSKI